MKKKDILTIGLIILAIFPWVIYRNSCSGLEVYCFSEYRRLFIILNTFGLALILPTVLSLIFFRSLLRRWLKGLVILIIALIVYINLSPDTTNIGDPTPERDAAIIISAIVIFIWSMSYLVFQKIKEKKSV